MIKSLQLTPDPSSPLIQSALKQTPDSFNLHLESRQTFPELSLGSIKATSSDKLATKGKTPDDSPLKSKNKENISNRKSRRMKLFSEQSGVENEKNDITFLESPGLNEKENKFTVSTPKTRDSIGVVDYFNSIDRLRPNDVSPQFHSKQKWKKDSNRSDESMDSKHSSSSLSKSRSFGGDNSYRGKDHKSNSRMSLGDFILNDSSPNENKKDKKNKVRKRITPTLVKGDNNRLLNSFSFEGNVLEKINLKDERHLLKQECESLSEMLLEKKSDFVEVCY